MLKGVIVAGNSLQYFQYIHRHNLNKLEYPLVMSLEEIRGYKDIPAYPVGDYFQLKDAGAIREYVSTHNMDSSGAPA